MATLGVTGRLDPFFKAVGYEIPGTWELMFSTRWCVNAARTSSRTAGTARPEARSSSTACSIASTWIIPPARSA